MYQTIVQAVLAHGKTQPDKLAVAFKKNQVTYGNLVKEMANMAAILKNEFKVERGDFVMISAVSKPEYVVAYLATQYLGAVSIPIDKSGKAENILDVYHYANPKVLLSDSKLGDAQVNQYSLKEIYARASEMEYVEENVPEYIPQDSEAVAEILFTTGTTGKPKGTMLSIGNIYASTHNTWHGIGMEPSDVVLVPLPLNHSVGMRETRTILYIGATLIIQNGFTFAKELENNINTFGCTALISVPASMEMIYRQMQDKFPEIMGKLRYMELGAGSLSLDMKKKLTKILPNTNIYNTWGSTETGGAIFLNVTKHQDKLLSLGIPMDGVELKVCDKEGNDITATARNIDTAGRMVLRGDMQMKGYYNMEEATKEALVDGWLYTNDMVYTDEDGFVFMLGRADDIINVGGEKVSPIEVENISQEFEQIRECACIGVPDPDGILGQIPALFVVPEGEFHENDLVKFLATKMEKYKLPKVFVLIQELPRNRMKKLDRKAIHRMWEEQGDKNLMNETVQSLLNRRSVRDFTEETISKAHLEMILQCGIYAPSGHNMQTWKFTVIRSQDKIAEFKEIVARVAKEKKVNLYGLNNPTVMILVSNDRRNVHAIQDSACAAENMMIAAQSYGIGSVWNNVLTTICDEPEIRELLKSYGIPDRHIVWANVAMGYPEKPGKLLAKKMNVVNWVE